MHACRQSYNVCRYQKFDIFYSNKTTISLSILILIWYRYENNMTWTYCSLYIHPFYFVMKKFFIYKANNISRAYYALICSLIHKNGDKVWMKGDVKTLWWVMTMTWQVSWMQMKWEAYYDENWLHVRPEEIIIKLTHPFLT